MPRLHGAANYKAAAHVIRPTGGTVDAREINKLAGRHDAADKIDAARREYRARKKARLAAERTAMNAQKGQQ